MTHPKPINLQETTSVVVSFRMRTDYSLKGEIHMALAAESIYREVYGYLVDSGEIEAGGLDRLLKHWNPSGVGQQDGIMALVNLCAHLRDDMASAANKAVGKGNVEKVMLSVIKSAEQTGRESLYGAFMQDGKQCVCDGYRAIRLNEPINLPEPPQPGGIVMSRIFAKGERDYQPLELPTLGEVKTFNKIKRAELKALYGAKASKHPVNWDFGEGKPLVNAAYLADMLTVFPDAKAEHAGETHPIFFEDELGDGLLLAVIGSA